LVGGHYLSPSLRDILHFKELSPPCENALQMASRLEDEKEKAGDSTLSKPTIVGSPSGDDARGAGMDGNRHRVAEIERHACRGENRRR